MATTSFAMQQLCGCLCRSDRVVQKHDESYLCSSRFVLVANGGDRCVEIGGLVGIMAGGRILQRCPVRDVRPGQRGGTNNLEIPLSKAVSTKCLSEGAVLLAVASILQRYTWYKTTHVVNYTVHHSPPR
jgi:hypothetical protein